MSGTSLITLGSKFGSFSVTGDYRVGDFRQSMSEPIICVPARNEAERLPSLMRSLQEQTWLRARKRPLQAVLVLNNCTDNSRAVIERIAPKLPDISLHLV